jgi:hypothetical protein
VVRTSGLGPAAAAGELALGLCDMAAVAAAALEKFLDRAWGRGEGPLR